MYLVGGIIAFFYLMLLFLSRKEKTEEKISSMLKPFYRMAVWIYKRVCIRKLPLFQSEQVERDLKRLCPGEGKEQAKANYYIRKLSLCLAILLVGTLFGIAVRYNSHSSLLLDQEGNILRGSYPEGSVELKLRTAGLEGEQETFQIEVAPIRLTEGQLKKLSDEFLKKLPELILGGNASLEQVTEDLVLEETYGDYPFSVEWKSDRPEIVGSTGRVYPQEESVPVSLQVKLTCEEFVREARMELQVVPEHLSPEERRHVDLEELLRQSEYDSRDQETWRLPGEWQGESVGWQQEVEDYSLGLWVAALVTAVVVYRMSDRDLHEQLEKRKKRMKQDYPDIVHKLVLYVGAGMTVRGAFQKLAADYEQGREKGMEERPAYEEMLYTCRELHSGVSEGAAYEHFGKRTGLQEYVRLCTLLAQNLKKGSSTLLERLKEEADKAGEERLQNSKRLGEEAGTKLLLPMVLMLLVVMIMIMIPAFSSM